MYSIASRYREGRYPRIWPFQKGWGLLVCGALFLGGEALAIQIVPTSQLFHVNAGEKTKGQFTLTNTEENDLNVVVETVEWFTSPVNKGIKPSDWLKLELPSFPLKKGESRTVPFTIQVPKRAKGEVMAMASFLMRDQKGSMLSFRLSVAVYAAIKGTEQFGARVESIAVTASSNTTVGVVLFNTGNVHVRPQGLCRIEDAQGRPVLNVQLDRGAPAHPGRARTFYGTVDGFRLMPGRYTAKITWTDMDWNYEVPPAVKTFTVTKEGRVQIK